MIGTTGFNEIFKIIITCTSKKLRILKRTNMGLNNVFSNSSPPKSIFLSYIKCR